MHQCGMTSIGYPHIIKIGACGIISVYLTILDRRLSCLGPISLDLSFSHTQLLLKEFDHLSPLARL